MKKPLRDQKWELEKKLRQLKYDEALEYYFRGTHKLYPELRKSLQTLVFYNWLQDCVEGQPFRPLRACCH